MFLKAVSFHHSKGDHFEDILEIVTLGKTAKRSEKPELLSPGLLPDGTACRFC